MKSTADKMSIGLGQRVRWRLRRRLVWVPVWGWIAIGVVIGVARPEIEPRLRRSVTPRGPVALFLASSGDDAVFDGDEPAGGIGDGASPNGRPEASGGGAVSGVWRESGSTGADVGLRSSFTKNLSYLFAIVRALSTMSESGRCFEGAGSRSRVAMRAVQPVWWLAPRPAPVSPWKYS